MMVSAGGQDNLLNVQVKSEPYDVDMAQWNLTLQSNVGSQPHTSQTSALPVTIKIEPDTLLGSHANHQNETMVIVETKEEKTDRLIDVDDALSADDIQQQVKNIIEDRLKDENSSMSDSSSVRERSVEQDGVGRITSVAETRSLADSAGSEIVQDSSRVVVKQQLDDSDEEEDSGEYMVLAEWTDGKLEELGASSSNAYDEGMGKKANQKSMFYCFHLFKMVN